MGERLLVRVRDKCALPGEFRVANEFRRPQHWLSLGEVVREVGGMCSGVRTVELLEGLCYLRVHPYPSSRRELSGQRVLHQSMCELVAAKACRDLGDEPGRDRFLERIEQLLFGLGGWARELLETELPANHRREPKEALARIRAVRVVAR